MENSWDIHGDIWKIAIYGYLWVMSGLKTWDENNGLYESEQNGVSSVIITGTGP